jgi:hypothetical protein
VFITAPHASKIFAHYYSIKALPPYGRGEYNELNLVIKFGMSRYAKYQTSQSAVRGTQGVRTQISALYRAL